MSHLIQAIVIGGGKNCIKHGATTPKWRTVSYLEAVSGSIALTGSEDDDSWVVNADLGGNAIGEIVYATCCIWKATVRFTLTGDCDAFTGDVYVAGDLISSFNQAGISGDFEDIVVDLDNEFNHMNRACGAEWYIYAGAINGTDPQITVSIIDVTFGPPV